MLDLAPQVPTPVWGRDERRAGDMWNSNSVVAWLIDRSGLPSRPGGPPAGGPCPGGTRDRRAPRGLAMPAERRTYRSGMTLERVGQRDEVEAVGLRDRLVGDLAADHVHALGERRVIGDRARHALVGERLDVRAASRSSAQVEVRGNRAGHVRDAVVDDAVDRRRSGRRGSSAATSRSSRPGRSRRRRAPSRAHRAEHGAGRRASARRPGRARRRRPGRRRATSSRDLQRGST